MNMNEDCTLWRGIKVDVSEDSTDGGEEEKSDSDDQGDVVQGARKG